MLKSIRFPASIFAFIGLSSLFQSPLHADDTQFLYLSGKGKDDPVKWDFMCSAGQNSGKWSTIGVPSNWELQGFGIYTYGTDRKNPWPKVEGQYKRTFTVPAGWTDKNISIVFEGVMTDTQVKVNGQSAGAMHQGGYYRFKYDVTKLLKAGENLLEVTVDDESSTPSVNNAERRGDYWNYAGIFRPVYLEAVPATSVERVAINAQADGSFAADIFTRDARDNTTSVFARTITSLEAQILDGEGKPIGEPMVAPNITLNAATHIEAKVANPRLWTAETPNLYQVELRLKVANAIVHTVRQKFGFRTIEARSGEGLFVNGSRIMLKGADRHSFWPDSGRCLSPEISKLDISVMKEMNMNAVRMSHYPPDQHFLDACDEMGMYVLDELAGWHQAYDTTTGHRLVQEMVTRDVNHPCILFWDNGNEGGWNTALDGDFAQWDPQKRGVIHPQQTQHGLDNSHYPQYNAVVTKSAANNVFFPTEMLHGLYDGGHGAGLEDYWKVMMAGKATAGGILWSFCDEDVVRTDKGGKLDSNGNQAPDGILGPYREKEGSFYTVKQLWSPIVIQPHTKSTDPFTVENRYSFIDLKDCTFTWEYRHFHRFNENAAGYQAMMSGKLTVEGSIPPGTTGKLVPQWGPAATMPFSADALAVTAKDPAGHEIWTWVWPLSKAEVGDWGDIQRFVTETRPPENKAVAKGAADTLSVTATDLILQFSKKTGLLTAASRAGKDFSFANGPRLLAAHPTPAAPARGAAPTTPLPTLPDAALSSLTQKTDGNDLLISATFASAATGETLALQGMKSITYRLHPNGWLTIDYAYYLTGPHEYFGVGFDYPEANVKGMRYLGNGPATVYQNRLAGGTLDVWEKKYNNTMVGDPDDLTPGQHFDYPIFKGYYAGVRWLQLQTSEGPITALLNQDDLFVQVLTPKTAPANQIGQTGVPYPSAGISFLHAIPAIGSKFTGPKTTGPQGQPAEAKGDYKGSISIYFGDLH